MTTPFHDLDEYLAVPRVGGLRLSPDGTWLAAAVQVLSPDKKKYLTSIWRIPASSGGGPARRLTRSAEGESGPEFLPDGSLLFTSKRADPESPDSAGEGESALWLLPPDGGEARVVAALPGGVTGVETGSGTVVVASPVLAAEAADDAAARKARKDAGVTAVLHETVPVRYWDHDLGPDDLRLFAVDPSGDEAEPRDLTPDAGRALVNQSFAVSPDGTLVATGWWQWEGTVQSHSELVLVDVATGKRTTLASDPSCDYTTPRFSPDGQSVVAERETHGTREKAPNTTLVAVPLRGNGDAAQAADDLLPDLDRWPSGPHWGADGVYFTADEGGRRPVFRDGERLTPDDGYYGDLNVTGGAVYALRMAVDEPFTPVRVDTATGEFERLQAPGQRPELPGTLEEIETTADDGHPVRAWLVLPEGALPEKQAPLLLWVHGGPMMSWNNWSWRWNPWLMAARGYAVLLPDPALSTGYGQEFVDRGYHSWGTRPYRDLMAVTDAACARPDIDETKTAMMGGSYGGYMANWIAGHTDRFAAIVSHAGLWNLEQMFGTTDHPQSWHPQFGDPLTDPEMYEANSPNRHIGEITTPMLVIHGARDYRVPFGEALQLWWDLNRTGVADAKFLYFPDENHWVLGPGNAKVWYETVEAFLARHVLGEPWRRPGLL